MLFLLDYCSIFDIFVYLKFMFIRYEYKFIEVFLEKRIVLDNEVNIVIM